MPNHTRENERDEAQLSQHAAQASALLSARANAKRGAGPDRPAEPEPPRADRPGGMAEFLKRNAVYIAAVVVVAVAVAVGSVALGAIVPHSANLPESAQGDAPYVSPYDWSNLERVDGRCRYIVNGEVKSRLGIDVSENQHEIDWQAVAGDGIDYAIIRVGYRGATEGALYLDEYYRANLEGARNAGLDVGLYFFSQARTAEEAVEEADFVLEYLGGMPLEYPIAFDSELSVLGVESPRTAGLSTDEMTAIAEAFCQRIERAGYTPVVYGNARDLARYHHDSLDSRMVWWAEYGVSAPAEFIDIDYWQYSNGGHVAGISTEVDMNIDLTGALG